MRPICCPHRNSSLLSRRKGIATRPIQGFATNDRGARTLISHRIRNYRSSWVVIQSPVLTLGVRLKSRYGQAGYGNRVYVGPECGPTHGARYNSALTILDTSYSRASQPGNEVEIELRIARHIAKQSFDKRVTTVMIRIPIL